jgi:DegV family protein with EDD domain
MAHTLVVTDSSAGLPPAVRRRAGLRIVPIRLQLVEGEGLDGQVDPRRVWRALERGDAVKTRAPSVLEYLLAIEEPGYDETVVITAAATFTGMHEHAVQAAGMTARPTLVVDSRTAAAAQGLVVRVALDTAAGGARSPEVAALASAAATRAHLMATVPGLGALERSGRVPADLLDTARRSGPSPMFQLADGELVPVEPAGGDPIEAIAEARAATGAAPADPVTVFHADAADAARRLARLLGPRTPSVALTLAMAVHTGPGVVGAAWLRP